MDNFEKVEKLREHANVTYEEAKEALENSNWDILDAMIYLEKNGKTRESQRAEYSTKTERCVGEVIDDGKEERGAISRIPCIDSPNGAVIFWTWAIPTASV